MSHLESGSVVWVRLGQAWWPGTITTIAKCPPEFVQAIRKTPIAIVKFFHENEYQDVHKAEHIFPYTCDRKEEFIRKGQAVNKNQSHGDVDLLAKFEADVVTAEKLTGGDMDILRTLVDGADTYKAFHPTHCPPTSPRLDSNNMVISGQPSQPPLASPCPAGVEFESRPQENLWPERVEAHTRLGSNTSKVRNPQNCQAASSDHQIALESRNSSSPLAAIAERDTDQTHPHLGGTSVITRHCSDNKQKEERSAGHLEKADFSQNVTVSLEEQVTRNYITIPLTRVTLSEIRSGGKLLEDEDEEEEEEEEEEEDSMNNELNSESEKLIESVDEDSLNLELDMEGEEDEPEPQRPVLEGEGEALESDSESDYLFELEDEEDGSLALLEPEQEGLADENEDSLIPDLEMVSEEEDEEVNERVDQNHLSQSWETDDDSEEELYHNLRSASATDEEEVGWVQSGVEIQNKSHDQMQALNPSQLKEAAGPGMNSSKGETEKEEPPREETALCQEEKGEESCTSEKTQGLITHDSLQKSPRPAQVTPLEPFIQQTYHLHHHRKGQNLEEEEGPKEEENEDPYDHQSCPHLPLTCGQTSHCKEMRPLQESMSCQDSKEPAILDLSVLDRPSTSKSPDNSLTFEGFDWEKTKQASARLLMLMKVRQLHPLRRTQSWKAKAVSRRRGRPPLKGRIGDLQGKRSGNTSLRRKRNQWHVSTTTSTTSETDEEQEEELDRGYQRSIRGRGSKGGGGWMKQRYARGRPSNRKLRHSSLRRKTLQHSSTERSVEKRKTRSSDKEREKETTKTIKKTRDTYERFTHSPDITSYSEAQPRQPRSWGGTREKENRSGQCAVPGNPPVKRARKRKPSEVDNLLKWAVETGHTGARNRGFRERHHSPSTVSITSSSTTNNNNNNNNATRRSRLETKTANKTRKKRGRKRKVRRDTGEEKDEKLERQAHTQSSSDDSLINSEEELSDTGKTTVTKGRPGHPYKSGDLVWVQLEGHWWPAYVDQVYPQTRRVSVYRVGLKQEASTKVDLARVKSFQYGEVPDFVERSESGFTEALQVTESFCLLRNHGNKISSHKFFTMPPEEQDALIIVSFTPKDDPALVSPQGKRTRGQTREEQQPMAHKGWYYESLNSDSEDGMGTRGEDKYMSARDRRRMQKALRSRRRENEKLIKYMKSAACMEHLWQIFSGQKQCERHKLYQSESTRRSLLWSGIGPFQLDQDDDQILSVVDFLHTEMNKKQPDFNLAQDYVFKVWMPEAIKEALRMVFKVPEDMLELALDEGYRENLTDRKTRRLDFL